MGHYQKFATESFVKLINSVPIVDPRKMFRGQSSVLTLRSFSSLTY